MQIINNIADLKQVAGLEGVTQFKNVDTFLSTAERSGFKVIEGGSKVINASGADITAKIVEFQPELTGGSYTGAVYTSNAVAGEDLILTEIQLGSLISLTIPEIIGGVFAGLGLGLISYEANRDMWIDISNNLFLNFPGYEPITGNPEDYSLLTLFDGYNLFIPHEIIERATRYAISNEWYNIYFNLLTDNQPLQPTINFNDMFFTAYAGMEFTPQGPSLPISAQEMYIKVLQKLNSENINIDEYNLFSIETQTYNSNTFIVYAFKIGDDIASSYENITDNFGNVRQLIDTAIENIEGFRLYILGYEVIETGEKSFFEDFELLNKIPQHLMINGKRIDSGFEANNHQWIANGYSEMNEWLSRTGSRIPSSADIPIEFPDWWSKLLEIPFLNPAYKTDPSVDPLKITRWLPISIPELNPLEFPVTLPQPIAQSGDLPADNTKPIGDGSEPVVRYPEPPVPVPSPDPVPPIPPTPVPPVPPTPIPIPTPIPPIPTIGGDANALFTVYNPTKSQLNRLGGVLWSNNVIQQIVTMFSNNPLDAIISLHIIYATPSTGDSQQIKLGYVPTNVSANVVSNQYINIDCGTVPIAEYFGDNRDYDNTKISIYLPFIGFRDLNVCDVMARNVSINYKVDVYTGTVLCCISVDTYGANQIMYTFEGNCAVNLPLTGADKSRQLASVGNVILGGAIGGVGGAVLAGTKSVLGGGVQADIQRSGNFSGNAGAMGYKKPYIIISRKIAGEANNYNELYGYTSNITVYLGNCRGYTRVKDVHVDEIDNASMEEKKEIEMLLKQGVIIN